MKIIAQSNLQIFGIQIWTKSVTFCGGKMRQNASITKFYMKLLVFCVFCAQIVIKITFKNPLLYFHFKGYVPPQFAKRKQN